MAAAALGSYGVIYSGYNITAASVKTNARARGSSRFISVIRVVRGHRSPATVAPSCIIRENLGRRRICVALVSLVVRIRGEWCLAVRPVVRAVHLRLVGRRSGRVATLIARSVRRLGHHRHVVARPRRPRRGGQRKGLRWHSRGTACACVPDYNKNKTIISNVGSQKEKERTNNCC